MEGGYPGAGRVLLVEGVYPGGGEGITGGGGLSGWRGGYYWWKGEYLGGGIFTGKEAPGEKVRVSLGSVNGPEGWCQGACGGLAVVRGWLRGCAVGCRSIAQHGIFLGAGWCPLFFPLLMQPLGNGEPGAWGLPHR